MAVIQEAKIYYGVEFAFVMHSEAGHGTVSKMTFEPSGAITLTAVRKVWSEKDGLDFLTLLDDGVTVYRCAVCGDNQVEKCNDICSTCQGTFGMKSA